MFRRSLALFALAFALLFAQQGGFAHELSHYARSSQTDKQIPHSPACEQCGAYSQVGAGATAHVSLLLPLQAEHLLSSREVAAPPVSRLYRQPSRAPPVLA